MPHWFPRSIFGAILTAVYVVIAVLIVASERRHTGGGWITLEGMGSYLITFPVSFLGERLGMRPDFRRNLDMLFAIGVCAMTLYFLGAGLARVARLIFSAGGHG
jgi:ABC-type Na+ efflux pump permease subunit